MSSYGVTYHIMYSHVVKILTLWLAHNEGTLMVNELKVHLYIETSRENFVVVKCLQKPQDLPPLKVTVLCMMIKNAAAKSLTCELTLVNLYIHTHNIVNISTYL